MGKISFLIGSCLLISLLIVGGCLNLGQGTTQQTKFYILNSLNTLNPEAKSITIFDNAAIGLGPIELPEYLDRPQIVRRISTNEFQLAGFSRWAEPLKSNFQRVWAENLAILLSAENIYFFPFGAGVKIDYQVAVQVARLDCMANDYCELRAYWEILDPVSNDVFKSGRFRQVKGSPKEGVAAAITTQSELMVEFSREIAQALITINSNK